MPFKNGTIVPNATVWTEDMIIFLKENYLLKTNAELAKALNLRLTVTRNKLSELGLKRMELEYWNDDQIQFLKDHYKTMGDVEIMEVFIEKWPKQKGWKRSAIHKKRKQMGLLRTPAEVNALLERHHKVGGSMFTITRNSSSLNMHPMWVAQRIAWRNPVLQKELVKRPDIIEAATALIKLKRVIKNKKSPAE